MSYYHPYLSCCISLLWMSTFSFTKGVNYVILPPICVVLYIASLNANFLFYFQQFITIVDTQSWMQSKVYHPTITLLSQTLPWCMHAKCWIKPRYVSHQSLTPSNISHNSGWVMPSNISQNFGWVKNCKSKL